jgi:hypothetical protein
VKKKLKNSKDMKCWLEKSRDIDTFARYFSCTISTTQEVSISRLFSNQWFEAVYFFTPPSKPKNVYTLTVTTFPHHTTITITTKKTVIDSMRKESRQ